MAQVTSRKKQKKDLTLQERIGQLFDDVITAGPRFSLRTIREYERIGMRAAEEREKDKREKQGLRIVARKVEAAPSNIRLKPPYTEIAVREAIALAEMFETAQKISDINPALWIKKKQGVLS